MAITEFLEAPHRKTILSVPGRDSNTIGSESPLAVVRPWKEYEKILFRFFFLYFVLQAVPLDWKYYRDVFGSGFAFSLHDIFYMARYIPRIVADVPVFADWAILAAIALAGTAVWTFADRSRTEYTTLYYALRVLVRYRLAVALLAYGFIKFFPLQMAYPSISHLNTAYGDLEAWKIFSISTGIVPGYQSFLGLVEIGAALLLLNRKTATIATFIILPFTGNVVMSNLAYEGGEYVYSLLLVTFALFLLVFDINRILRLTSFERTTQPNRYKPDFAAPGWKYGRLALKASFVFVFVFVYGYQAYAASTDGGYQYSNVPGLQGAAGLYTVTEFRINDTALPYTTDDEEPRWRDVVFESWATLSIRSNRQASVVEANTEEIIADPAERNYEYTGSAGRRYFSYTADTTAHTLLLTGKNVPGEEEASLLLHYTRPDAETIVLRGVNADNDSLHIVLNRVNKKYLLQEAAKGGRRQGLKL